MSESDHTSTTGKLRVLAPAAAEWPSWWRRNLTPGALYIIGAVVLAATVTVTTFIVTIRHDSTDLADVKTIVTAMSTDMGIVKDNVADLKKWKDENDKEARRLAQEANTRNPYVRGARKATR